MKLGIVGAGKIGGTVGRLWHRAGHEVKFGTRHPAALAPLVAELGARASAGTPEDAARFGEVVLLAVPLAAIPALGPALAPLVAGKVVLDAGNPYPDRDGAVAREALAHTAGSSGWVASHLPDARIVKAFNTIEYRVLGEETGRAGDPLGIPVAGDDADAVDAAARLVRDAGFAPLALGGLIHGKQFEPGSTVYNADMSVAELARALGVDPP
ncbi:MAG TPA: NAD(P)-binding domain-containing protein [Haliangiales bacterium]|nr:NAD(P)-binding domain-containing protein [Haliangiales bacterium]